MRVYTRRILKKMLDNYATLHLGVLDVDNY